LHDLRKDAKKLRYLLECFGGLFPAKPRRAFVGQLKALQDNLGEHQDAEVHLAQLRVLARELHAEGVDADVLLAMGRLGDQLERRRRQERDDFAARFAAYDTKANRRALDELIGDGARV
jgi:CHAD domain-containing protein